MPAIQQNFELFQGDRKRLIFTVRDGTGSPLNIDGADIVWKVKQRFWDADPPLIEKSLISGSSDGIEIIDGPSGIFQVDLFSEDSEELNGDMRHEVKLTDIADNEATVSVGKMTVNVSLFHG